MEIMRILLSQILCLWFNSRGENEIEERERGAVSRPAEGS